MTFNILYGTAPKPVGGWSARRKLAADVIEQCEPDVGGLQEAMAHQLSDLAADLPGYHFVEGPISGHNHLRKWAGTVSPALGVARRYLLRRLQHSAGTDGRPKSEVPSLEAVGTAGTPGTRAAGASPAGSEWAVDHGEHCAIFYRKDRFRLAESGAFWLSERPDQPGTLLRGTWRPRVVHWVRLEEIRSPDFVTLYNAHMDYLPWAPPRSAKILRERLDREWNGTPQFLVGDLNTPARSAAFRILLRSDPRNPQLPPLRDAWAEAVRLEGPAQTLHRGTGRGSWPGRIDHILFRPQMRVERVSTVTHSTDKVYPSDHFPVVAELRREEHRRS
jgi:endonuclease/exonuclease/phosphatase family metal-dependent hydrolase